MEKNEKVHFSVVIVLCDREMQSTSTNYEFYRSRSLSDFGHRSLPETTSPVALLTTILGLLTFVYKRSVHVSSYRNNNPKSSYHMTMSGLRGAIRI